MIGIKDMKNLSKYLSKNSVRSPAWGVMCITGGGAPRHRRLGTYSQQSPARAR
jgi:hypothetical protein